MAPCWMSWLVPLTSDGRGTYTAQNGEKYNGEWQNDQRHGKGKFSTPSGLLYEGEWQEDKYIEDKK